MRRKRLAIEDLRTAIDCLPVDTRVAMLHGVRSSDIIVGAYADRRGGVCPMLAAHRCGGRTSFLAFARAWDRFAGAKRMRRATERELRVLIAHLEASLLREEEAIGSSELAAAIADHRSLVERRCTIAAPGPSARPSAPRPGDPERSRELRSRPGWSWLRPFRRYDEYERALARLEQEREAAAERRERERSPA